MNTRVLTIAAMLLASGAVGAMAEDHMTPPPDQQHMQSHPMNHEEEEGQGDTGATGHGGMMPGGMMGHGMMGQGMMGHGMGGHGMMARSMMGGHGMQGCPPVMFRMIFALMDSDGDGTIELPEFQAAHEKIFKAMDANKDGKVTPEEMEAFMHGPR